MNEKTNYQLTLICSSTGYSGYIGASNVSLNPASIDASAGVGKSGDYYWEDPSLYFKVGTQWIVIDPSGAIAWPGW